MQDLEMVKGTEVQHQCDEQLLQQCNNLLVAWFFSALDLGLFLDIIGTKEGCCGCIIHHACKFRNGHFKELLLDMIL